METPEQHEAVTKDAGFQLQVILIGQEKITSSNKIKTLLKNLEKTQTSKGSALTEWP